MITAITLLALVSVCSASSSSSLSDNAKGWHKDRPTNHYSRTTISGSWGSQYVKNQHHDIKLVTCSSPPSSIEVCLSSVFSSIEIGITKVVSELKIHEVSIKYNMHHEHTLLTSEVSFVYDVESIAKSVKYIVNENYYALYEQLADLIIEKEDIYDAYAALEQQLLDIEARVKAIEIDINEIDEEYESIKYAKWSVYSAISAIVYEKMAVEEEVAEVEYIVEYLNAEVQKIYGKIEQLNKRQNWLVSWQEKLYVDLNEFEVEVKRFKGVEASLYAKEKEVYIEQERLLSEINAVVVALEKLHAEYEYIAKEVIYIQAYENEVVDIYYYVKEEASIFIGAYEQFTCEDNLLYYEACASSSKAAVGPTVAPKTGAKTNQGNGKTGAKNPAA